MWGEWCPNKVRDGAKVRFSYDVWCGDQTLKETLPTLFSIAHLKEASVADHMQFSNNTLEWNITCIGSVHDWEEEVVSSFFNLLYSLKL